MTPDHRPACGVCSSAIEYGVAATVVERHNDIARKRVEDEPGLRVQIEADRRQAGVLNNSQEREALAERAPADVTALPSPDSPDQHLSLDPRVLKEDCPLKVPGADSKE